jgi:hypothetical protein
VHSPKAFRSEDSASRLTAHLYVTLFQQLDQIHFRTLGGLLIRAGKPLDAIAPLKQAIAMRANDRPPVEKLLLAFAHLEAKQPEEAAKWHAQAVAWLDRYQPPLTSVLGGGYLGTATIQKSQMDPRYNAFDWESWHECDVFRAEVERRLPQR